MTRRLLPVLVAGGLLTAGAVASLAVKRERAPLDPARAELVETIAVRHQEGHAIERRFTGRVEARREATLSFEVPGLVAAVPVDEGQEVEDGAVLARLDTARIAARKEALLASHRAAQAQLDEMVAGPRRERIAAQEAAVAALEADIELARADLARLEPLLASGSATPAEGDRERARLRGLRARKEQARQQLEELNNGERPERLAAQRARVDELWAQVVGLEIEERRALLRAPFAGRIVARHLEPGSIVAAGTPVLELQESEGLEARIGVPLEVAARLAKGSTVSLVIEGRLASGEVRSVLTRVDSATRTRPLIVRLLDKEARRAVPGELVRLRVRETVPQPGVWLPATALRQSFRGLWSCFVVPESGEPRLQMRQLLVLHEDGDRVYVAADGLEPGEQVVSTRVEGLAPGQLVRLATPALAGEQ